VASLNLRILDSSLRDRTVHTAAAEARTDKAATTFWRWTFWINGGLHVLYLVVGLIAIFRS
jgi:hypothetical protein